MDVREKLVELIDDFIYNVDLKHWYSEELDEKLADELIANRVTVQDSKGVEIDPFNKWISVKDRLPENDGQYLIFTTQYFTPDHIDEIDHRDGIEISGYYKGYGFLSTNGIYAKYWCCLPQPPKGE